MEPLPEKRIHPRDARETIEDGFMYRLDGVVRMSAKGARLYFDNLLRLGIPVEEILDKIEQIKK